MKNTGMHINSVRYKEKRDSTEISISYEDGEDIVTLKSEEEPVMEFFQAIQGLAPLAAIALGMEEEARNYVIVTGCSFKGLGEDILASVSFIFEPPQGLVQVATVKVMIDERNSSLFKSVEFVAESYLRGDRKYRQGSLLQAS